MEQIEATTRMPVQITCILLHLNCTLIPYATNRNCNISPAGNLILAQTMIWIFPLNFAIMFYLTSIVNRIFLQRKWIIGVCNLTYYLVCADICFFHLYRCFDLDQWKNIAFNINRSGTNSITEQSCFIFNASIAVLYQSWS